MKSTDKLNQEIESVNEKDTVRDVNENAGDILTDEDLDNASGGAYFGPRPNRRT